MSTIYRLLYGQFFSKTHIMLISHELNTKHACSTFILTDGIFSSTINLENLKDIVILDVPVLNDEIVQIIRIFMKNNLYFLKATIYSSEDLSTTVLSFDTSLEKMDNVKNMKMVR